MRRVFQLSICLLMFLLVACEGGSGFGSSAALSEEPPPPAPGFDDPIASARSSCDGTCWEVPQATFTGPSLFWFGPPSQVPECPPETPFQGIQGYIQGRSPPSFARECLVTPSDTCEKEGMVCIPKARENYQACSHHLGLASSCGGDHEIPTLMIELDAHFLVALCCAGNSSPH